MHVNLRIHISNTCYHMKAQLAKTRSNGWKISGNQASQLCQRVSCVQYQNNWTPFLGEILQCSHEESNVYNPFAIKVIKDGSIVGH